MVRVHLDQIQPSQKSAFAVAFEVRYRHDSERCQGYSRPKVEEDYPQAPLATQRANQEHQLHIYDATLFHQSTTANILR